MYCCLRPFSVFYVSCIFVCYAIMSFYSFALSFTLMSINFHCYFGSNVYLTESVVALMVFDGVGALVGVAVEVVGIPDGKILS